MVNYLDSRRIMGTTSERSSIPSPATQGGWVELARTTLGSPASSINVTSLTDKRYYMYLTSFDRAATLSAGVYLNSDTGSNFSFRYSVNGAADAPGTSDNRMFISGNALTGRPDFGVGYVANLSTKEKLAINHFIHQETAGAATAPSRWETAGKHAQTSNPVNAIGITGTNNFATGSEVVVLGWDPADSHTNNFWEELASDEASGSVASLESGTISAKKYLWIQCYISGTSASTFCETLFNNDTGANYASRASQNGGSDFTRTSETDLNMFESYSNTTGAFLNAFIINNASNEKLGISHSVREATSGAGNAPARDEVVFKWTNTSSQITDISFTPQSGTINSGSILKVWGAD